MHILIAYSKMHFDPYHPSAKKYSESSAHILANSIYKICKKIGNVTYIDALKEFDLVKGKKFDLFIGIASNFNKIAENINCSTKIFLAVNMHPKERNLILFKYIFKNRINPHSISPWDFVDSKEITRSINKADFIIAVGNMMVYNSYIKNGVSKSKIKMINYSVLDEQRVRKKAALKKSFLYVASEIGLRKGFDILYSIFTSDLMKKSDYSLDIVGNVYQKYYKKKLERLVSNSSGKIKYYGWVDSSSAKYKKILLQSDFLIYPSVEEGQAGTVLESMATGVIPVTTLNSGIDFHPLGFLETKRESARNLQILNQIVDMKREDVVNLNLRTLGYYTMFHDNFPYNLQESLALSIKDNIYPKISVIMPIFNKGKTILSLLQLLHKACLEYRNIELIIIFDGCRDNTEQVTRNFYKGVRDYKVIFKKTPNIFETKTNNIGLKLATGKYCVAWQDDNYVYDKNIFFEVANLMDKSPKMAVLGLLAGVNYYPRGTINLKGKGQIVTGINEVYWRQDKKTDSRLKNVFFQTDACMRPFAVRKDFLEKHGYLDEIYAPLYQDDIDLCFRARSKGYSVYCGLFDVVNKVATMGHYDAKKNEFFRKVMKRNTDTFYRRWEPTTIKNYDSITRTKIFRSWLEKIEQLAGKITLKENYYSLLNSFLIFTDQTKKKFGFNFVVFSKR